MLDHRHVRRRERRRELAVHLLHRVDPAALQLARVLHQHAREAHARAALVAEAVRLGDPELGLERGAVGAGDAAAVDENVGRAQAAAGVAEAC